MERRMGGGGDCCRGNQIYMRDSGGKGGGRQKKGEDGQGGDRDPVGESLAGGAKGEQY